MKTVEEIIKEQIEQIDITDVVNEEARRLVREELHREISKTTKERIDKLIEAEVRIVLNKPLKTDDGWGKKNEYESFEQMFKAYFLEKLNNNYDIKRELDRMVKAKVEELFEKQKKETVNKVVNEMLKAVEGK